jgi:transcriptional regulator with GAF, ATPase, and Fis domain
MQSGEVRRVGATQMRRVNVRVIGASNTSLRQLATEDKFRADLYYRLSVLSIEVPPLRFRAGDVELLTAWYLEKFREPGCPLPFLTQAARSALAAHDYPGNVRELENALRRAITLSSNGLITAECLPPEIAAVSAGEDSRLAPRSQDLISDRPGMDELQHRYLQLVLEETGWNRRRAAAVLQLDRRTVQRLIARYKLEGAAANRDDDGDDNEEAAVETAS